MILTGGNGAERGIKAHISSVFQQPLPNSDLALLVQATEITAPRDSTPTNGALREFLLEFIDTYIVPIQNEYQGSHRGGMTDVSRQ